nr:immunoglobulin heavy chain junction region [Macaca mulatta]MOV38439.1 immunoglobulin heavy chain junction region [Macaca mulatta]MOV38548.1 immunoglobulin heavy chain junction region [Macaca mulatta]MOV42365.1 immunoglobulin heavy chain junction region [Macaca mulatta]MOV42405.1 immunoglobulin heavy chain junction region [Macaca mulatta]
CAGAHCGTTYCSNYW